MQHGAIRTKDTRLSFMDVLKGIAIIMIIAVHNRHFIMLDMSGLRQIINFGQMGCQIFFLVSGFCLCFSWRKQLLSNPERGFLKSMLFFISRRFLRIAPGYYIILFATLLLNHIQLIFPDFPSGFIAGKNIKGIVLNLCFLHGFSPEYINDVFPGGWYIGTAFILYCLFPLLYILFEKLFYYMKYLVFLVPFVFLALYRGFFEISSSVWSLTLFPYNNSFWYYFFPNQLPCFSLGIVLFFWSNAGLAESISEKKSIHIQKAVNALLFALAAFFLIISIYVYIKYTAMTDIHYAYLYVPFLFGLSVFFMALPMICSNRAGEIYHPYSPCDPPVAKQHFPIGRSAHKNRPLEQISGGGILPHTYKTLSSLGKNSYGMYLVHSFISWHGMKLLTHTLAVKGYVYNDLALYLIVLIPSVIIIFILGKAFEKLLSFRFRR